MIKLQRPMAAALLCLGLAACDTATPAACQVHADCASGLCRSDGTCAPADAPDAGAEVRFAGNDLGANPDDAATAGDATADSALPADAATAPDTTLDTGADAKADATVDAKPDSKTDAKSDSSGGACLPDHDGVLTRAEVQIVPGLKAKWLAAQDAQVDLHGQLQPDGMTLWQLEAKLPGDAEVPVETLDPKGAWWTDKFPGAHYAARLAAKSDLLGVFEWTDTALLLRGVVSPEPGLFQTRLTYDPPVPLLVFPMQQGSQWTAKSTVSGQAQGVISAYSESYEVTIDAKGAVSTPFGNFPVLRARVELERVIGLMPVHRRSYLFLAECFGTVATVDSHYGESELEFTEAAEIRRLTP